MTYEEIVNSPTKERREARCRRDWMIGQAVRWGGWVLTGLVLVMALAVSVS